MEGGFLVPEEVDAASPQQHGRTHRDSKDVILVSNTSGVTSSGVGIFSGLNVVPGKDGYSSGCSRCSSLSYSEDFWRAFGVRLCMQCRKNENLISKTNAKQQYLLSESDLKPLGSLERKNPKKKDWNAMKLYMEAQVRDVCYAKYGGQAGLEREARNKVSKKLESRLKEKERQVYEESRRSKRLKEIHEDIKAGQAGEVDKLVEEQAEEI